MIITVGIDIGQRVDPTALIATELQWRQVDNPEPGQQPFEDHYVVRYLESLPLGTKYPEVEERLEFVVRDIEERVHEGTLRDRAGWLEPTDYAQITTYVDATGVGLPVVQALQGAGVPVIGVHFNHGDRRIEQTDEGTGEFRIVLGKAYIVSRLQVLLQTRRLHFPKIPEARDLARELLTFSIKVDENANAKYGAFKVGDHDDLVTALGLSVNKTPIYLHAAASAPSMMQPMQVPHWAGIPKPLHPHLPIVGGRLVRPDMLPRELPGSWGADGGSGLDRLRNR